MPYREAEFIEQPPKGYVCNEAGCTYPVCNCGHSHDEHWWFNSEFIECKALGHYSESMIRGKLEKHQRMPNCKCEHYSYDRRFKRS